MAIIQNLTETPGDGNFTFPVLLVNRHTQGRWKAPVVTHVFPGVTGVKQYLDSVKERPIVADVHLYDRASEAALNGHLLQIESYTHLLRGDLEIDGTVYPPCSFHGVEYLTPNRWDPNHGWHRKCRLFWTQRRPL